MGLYTRPRKGCTWPTIDFVGLALLDFRHGADIQAVEQGVSAESPLGLRVFRDLLQAAQLVRRSNTIAISSRAGPRQANLYLDIRRPTPPQAASFQESAKRCLINGSIQPDATVHAPHHLNAPPVDLVGGCRLYEFDQGIALAELQLEEALHLLVVIPDFHGFLQGASRCNLGNNEGKKHGNVETRGRR